MSEALKPCPVCGKGLKVYGPEDWKPTFYDPDSGCDPYNAVCDCGFSFSNGSYDYKEFLEAVNHRPHTDNEPLTLEQLREMDGEPVWICSLEANQDIINEWYQFAYDLKEHIAFFMFGDDCEKFFKTDEYGKTWLAYRRKPEEAL